MTSIQPELWVERASQAVTFYTDAFGARVLHRVGEGDDIVVQLAVGEAAFWVAAASPDRGRLMIASRIVAGPPSSPATRADPLLGLGGDIAAVGFTLCGLS